MHHSTDRITHATAFVTPVVKHWLEREIAQWVHPESPVNATLNTLLLTGISDTRELVSLRLPVNTV